MNNSIYQLLSQSPIKPGIDSAQTSGDNKQITEVDQQARDTARKFEALLVHTMLKNMRSSNTDDPLINSDQLNLYKDMFDQEIAKDIATNGSFGVADVIYRQLTEKSASAANSPTIGNLSTADKSALQNVHRNTQSTTITPASPTRTIRTGVTTSGTDKSKSELFIERLEAHAVKTAQILGTTKEAVIAIAALETGWGNRVALNPDGSSSHNLFGIKADQRWSGQQSISQTSEYRDGNRTVEYAAFRSYPNERQSVEDFANFIKQNPRYQKALSTAADGEEFITELQRAGYATDPDYADKAIAIMHQVKSHTK